MALSPMLFIGVGGTGGKTLRVIHKALEDTLKGVGWRGDLPAGWQFLHVDVAAVEDGIDPEIPLTLPHRDYAPLTESTQIYSSVDGQVDETGRAGLDHYLAWNSWRPWKPSRVEVAISGGAGQFRAVGRVALLAGLREKLAPRIKTSIDAARNGSGTLEEAQRALGQTPGSANRAVRVMVIASLGGGSGSGAILDVCDAVRAIRDGEHEEITAVVYTPEVFRRGGGFDSGIAPNTFMGINELINADWVQDSRHMPISRAVHFERAGLSPDLKGSGPDNVFLVGNRNDAVSLGGATEIYKVFGRALSEFALSETQQDKMTAYARTNREQIAKADGMKHNVPFKVGSSPTFTNLYAMGFARLSIGRELFKEYAVQRLAREAIVRLRDHHRAGVEASDARTDEQIVEAKAQYRWGLTGDDAADVVEGRFLDQSGLSEFGKDENDITHMLLPVDDFDRRFAEWRNSTLHDITGKHGDGAVDRNEVCRMIETSLVTAVESEAGPRKVELADDLYRRAIDWRWDDSSGEVRGINHSLATLVVNELAESGIRVTLRLLGMLRAEMQEAVEDLGKEQSELLADYDTAMAAIRSGGSAARKSDLGVIEQEYLDGKARDALWAVYYSDACRVAEELLKEIAYGLIAPLEMALEDARDNLMLDIRGSEEHPSPLDVWPKIDSAVPTHLRPSKVEFTLDDVEQFPAAFDEQMLGSAEGNSAMAAMQRAVSEIIIGEQMPIESKVREAFHYRATWAPRQPDRLRAPREAGARAAVDIRIGLEDLLERARAWVDDRQKKIGRYANQQLAEYLGEGASGQRRERRERLVSQFREMLKHSMPLVKIDSERYQMAHGRSVPLVEFVLAPLNLPSGDTEIVNALRDVAAEVRHEPTTISVSSTGSGTSVITTLKQPVHLVAVDSIMAPILGQWDATRGDPDLWKFTRTRPVSEWVPMAPDAQLALAVGWLTGRLLGRARLSARPDGGRVIEVRVGVGASARWVALSTEGIRRVNVDNALGNLYELYTLAQIEVYRSASLDPLRPFNELLEAGSRDPDEHPIRTWIDLGEGLDEAGAPVLAQAITQLGMPASDPAERADIVLKALDQMEALYREDAGLVDGPTDIGDLQDRVGLEVVPLALHAIADLRELARVAVKKAAVWGR